MAAFDNTMGITKIEFQCRTRNYCPLGEDMYTNQFTVVFIPSGQIPDYVDIQNDINNNVDGKDMTVEDAVEAVYNIVDRFKPEKLCVESYADDAVHFPVTVTKCMEY